MSKLRGGRHRPLAAEKARMRKRLVNVNLKVSGFQGSSFIILTKSQHKFVVNKLKKLHDNPSTSSRVVSMRFIFFLSFDYVRDGMGSSSPTKD